MQLKAFIITVLLLSSFGTNLLLAQNVEKVVDQVTTFKERWKNDPFKLNGGINAFMAHNYISGIERRQDPFSYRIGGTLTADVLGWRIPASVYLSNGRTIYNYNLPSIKLPAYSLVGFRPSYKWIQLHAGNSSISFSPYTFSGHSFQGGGMELTPGKFTIKSMYGRLRRAVASDLDNLNNIETTFRRWGWGGMLGYESTKGERIQAIIFKGWDDANSISTSDSTFNIQPKENVVISLAGKKVISSKLSLEIDYALSALTTNTYSPDLTSQRGILRTIGGLFTPKASSGYHNAVKTSLQLQTGFGSVQLNHEWVDPGYQTLGALFFNNDFENWTVSSAAMIKEGKLMLAGNIGVQRNNLRDNQVNDNRRFIGMITANIVASESLNFSASFSNFSVTNRLRAITFPVTMVDSIILSQVNSSASFSVSHIAGKEKNVNTILMCSFQQANSIENDEVNIDQRSSNYMVNLSHNRSLSNSLILSGSIMFNRNSTALANINSFAPTIAASKPIIKDKLTANLSTSFVSISSNALLSSNMLSMQLGAQYKPFEKHNINFSATLVNRSGKSAQMNLPAFLETNLTINYGWSF